MRRTVVKNALTNLKFYSHFDYKISDKTKQLRKENQALKEEDEELKLRLYHEKMKEFSKQGEQWVEHKRSTPKVISSDEKAVEFMSEKYDELIIFKEQAKKGIQQISTRVKLIS